MDNKEYVQRMSEKVEAAIKAFDAERAEALIQEMRAYGFEVDARKLAAKRDKAFQDAERKAKKKKV